MYSSLHDRGKLFKSNIIYTFSPVLYYWRNSYLSYPPVALDIIIRNKHLLRNFFSLLLIQLAFPQKNVVIFCWLSRWPSNNRPLIFVREWSQIHVKRIKITVSSICSHTCCNCVHGTCFALFQRFYSLVSLASQSQYSLRIGFSDWASIANCKDKRISSL